MRRVLILSTISILLIGAALGFLALQHDDLAIAALAIALLVQAIGLDVIRAAAARLLRQMGANR